MVDHGNNGDQAVRALLTLTVVYCVLGHAALSGQVTPPVVEWEKTYGGHIEFAVGRKVQQTTDGGYIVVGATAKTEPYQVYLLKTDANGEMEWSRTFGGNRSRGESVTETHDGGYLVTGWSDRVYLIKTYPDGREEWSRTFGEEDDRGYDCQQTTDGGYIVLAWTTHLTGTHAYLIKTDARGELEWSRTVGSTSYVLGHSVQQTLDGGYILSAGRLRGYHPLLVKTDSLGTVEWSWTDRRQGLAMSVLQTLDGGYVATGTTVGGGAPPGVLLVRIEEGGVMTWWREWARDFRTGASVEHTLDGGYIVAGLTWGGSEAEAFVMKTDADGNELWSRRFPSSPPAVSRLGFTAQQTSDGGYILAGTYRTTETAGIFLVKLAPESGAMTFTRGDANSSGKIDITDGIAMLNYLFLRAPPPGCLDAADVDDSGQVELTDAVGVLNWLFLSGKPPPEPMPSNGEYVPADCGTDDTPDRDGDLGCVTTAETCS